MLQVTYTQCLDHDESLTQISDGTLLVFPYGSGSKIYNKPAGFECTTALMQHKSQQ